MTVLFADVAGFTTLSERLDPEAVHDLMDDCFTALGEQVHRYEGTINLYAGDGIMALFGAPIAHEDHALRAAHAALDIQASLADFGAGVERRLGLPFRMRVGLNTGPVVVGQIGDDLRMDYTALGDTVNLAATPEAMRPQPARRTARSRSGATATESTIRRKATIGRTIPSTRSCWARWAIWARRLPVVPCPTEISPDAAPMRWPSAGFTTAIAFNGPVHGLLQLDHARRGVLGEQPSVQALDRPAEDLLEAVARDDPAHHGPHERLGALGVGASAGDQLGGQGVGEVVLDVGRGERRVGSAPELARVEELGPDVEHDRPEDDRQDR